jgi:hypothetical protein
MQRYAGIAVLAVLAVLVAATVYEALVALRIVDLGSLPGEAPPGGEAMGVLAAVGLLAATLVSVALVREGNGAPALAALLAPAAGAFLVARFYAFDAYYLPTLIRYADRNFVPPAVVFVLAGLAVGGGLLTLRSRRVGIALSVPAILACALAAWYSGVGH